MKIKGVRLYFLPVKTRVPFHFGHESMTEVICARAAVVAEDADGRHATGWGETPLNVQWMWPSTLPYGARAAALREFCLRLAKAWAAVAEDGHPFEQGSAFIERALPGMVREFNATRAGAEPMPWLAALVCCSAFDLAVYDAFGMLAGKPVFETLGRGWLAKDLSARLQPAGGAAVSFAGKYPADFLRPAPKKLVAWHTVGSGDALEESDLNGREPEDGHPVLLRDWIKRDGLRCLKIKLHGNDAEWDYARLVRIAEIGRELGVLWLCADYNCAVADPAYVTVMLDRLLADEPTIYGMLLYVEQPFPYELEEHPIDVHAVTARKPLFMDESAHDWRFVRRGRELGWSSVALKTCKTLTGALLSLCWARAHGMTLMVQDLTNPMLAMIPHALLAAHAGTIMGVETNAPQYYPDASRAEESAHPGLYRRREGNVDLSTLTGPGFGYHLDRIKRELPPPAAAHGNF
jgi:L-alanine-DL-glutamate epimerase-like enolase superfamily enzyme